MVFKKIAAAMLLSCVPALGFANTFSVQYKPVATAASNNKIEGEVRVTNTSSAAVNLSSVSIQYYMTKEGTAAMVATSDYAAVLGSNYRDVTAAVAVAFATNKLNITFGSTAGTLPAGQTVHVQFRANNTDWFLQNQTNDPSFNGSLTTFTPVTNITVNGGATPVAISGVIKNTTGGVIAGAKVKYPGGEATTAANGTFTASAPLSAGSLITVSAPGYADVTKAYTPSAGKLGVYVNLLKVDTTAVINTNQANTVRTPGGAEVTFPVMTGVPAQLSVAVTHIRSNTRDILSASGDFSAIRANGSEVQLSSQGMIDVVVKNPTTGEVLSLANKGPFQIKIPASIPSTAPASIPLWYFNTANGKWMEEGSASLVNGIYSGNVTHFTSWNADVPNCGGANAVCSCIAGALTDPSNVNLANSNLYTIVVEGSGWSKTIEATTTDFIPNFSILRVPAGPARVTVTNRTTNWSGSLNKPVDAGPGCTSFPVTLARVSVTGTITNACNSAVVTGANIELINQSGVVVATTTSNATGTYSFPAIDLPQDVGHTIRITHPSFVTNVVNNFTVTDNQVVVIDRSLQVPVASTGILKGRVLNANDGNPIPNATIQVRAGIDNVFGAVVFTGTSDANGTYNITTLPPGSYYVTATTANGSASVNGQSAACSINAPNIVLGPSSPTFRVIMSWNEGTPNDLDSYLYGPNFRLNYTNKTIAGVATLNIDAMGPNTVEVTTLLQETAASEYVFAVHNFSNSSDTNSQVLSRSGVSVTVIRNGQYMVFNIPPNTVGTLWKVFKMVDGVITPINTVSNTAP